MEKRMERSLIYNGTITAEQFLFYEIRIASKYYLDGTSVEDAIEEIKKNNLFQYPTERLVARMVRSCYKRLDALDDEQLRQELSSAPAEIANRSTLCHDALQPHCLGLHGRRDRRKVPESGLRVFAERPEYLLLPLAGTER